RLHASAYRAVRPDSRDAASLRAPDISDVAPGTKEAHRQRDRARREYPILSREYESAACARTRYPKLFLPRNILPVDATDASPAFSPPRYRGTSSGAATLKLTTFEYEGNIRTGAVAADGMLLDLC